MAAMKPFSRTPEEGAETLIWLAESNGFIDHSGCYYADKQVGKTSEAALDKDVAKRLWDISENRQEDKRVASICSDGYVE